MTDASSALIALADLLKSGLSVRQALLGWPDELSGEAKREAEVIVQRLALGCSVGRAVADCSLSWVLLPAFSLHFATGVDVITWLERVAADNEESAAAWKASRGAAAGAALSGRMVAGLPLLFVPLTPMTRAPMADPLGIAMVLVGISLTVIGLRWIGRLLPRPPAPDPVADLCVTISAILRAGLPVDIALRVASRAPGASGELVRAGRLSALGWTWPEALAAGGEGLSSLASSIRRAQRFGLPLADVLDQAVHARRSARKRTFEAAVKRAPVLMVVPLTLCVLPAYALLALGPFLRSLSLS